jgi:hypothetical protein
MEPTVPPNVRGSAATTGRKRTFFSRAFSVDNLAGDVRSAVIASVTGSIIGAVAGLLAAALFTATPLEFIVDVNSSGYGQPKGLFDTAQKEDKKLQLQFVPPNLRETYVCEFKRVTGADWKRMVLDYLDTYRECFDVSARGENSFLISANNRSTRLVQKDGAFLCKCGGSLTRTYLKIV